MKKLYKFGIIALAISSVACERRPLSDICQNGEELEVIIDWRISGINPGTSDQSDFVHRVSLRFFPKDGAAPFDRYLEGNVFNSKILLPEGEYSVVAFNEAIDDPYWDGAVIFTQTNSYSQFAANIAPVTPVGFVFYPSHPDLHYVGEPYKLASWSLDQIVITKNMRPSDDPNAMVNSLKKVVMRKLYVDVRVVAEVENLNSAMRIEGAVEELSNKVYMASGLTNQSSSTHLFAFTSPVWDGAAHQNGYVERRYLGFGAQPQAANYALSLGVIFVSGERYDPTEPLQYNITQQIDDSPKGQIEIRVGLTLPKVDGGINVGDWDDEEITIQ